MLVVAVFVGAPILGRLLIPAQLPLCTSSEVSGILQNLLLTTPIGVNVMSVDGLSEIGYDRELDVRHGECVAHTDAGNTVVTFVVAWLDRSKAQFQVRIPLADLPTCTDPEVVRMVEQVVRGMLFGAELTSIDGHRQVRHDARADRRHCECVAHTTAGEIPVVFLVEWQNRFKGTFQVKVPPDELPACVDPRIVKLLEQLIPGIQDGATLESVDGIKELKFDTEPEVRYGDCIVRTKAGRIAVRFVVEWNDRSKGLYQVRMLGDSE